MKIAVNKCYGGFGLSPEAVRRIAEIKGLPCYFFKVGSAAEGYIPISIEQAKDVFLWWAFTVETVPEKLDGKSWDQMTFEEKGKYNKLLDKMRLPNLPDYPNDRSDPILIQVIEELGEKANGKYAKIEIVEIPDDVDWEIDEYDGMERIRERSRSW